ncbi:MAG: hypothetical protein KY453_09330, partial [Gemmatimonadetes bacterium]|nr:hypothetical protein [Gemmatimonadota bacterium]
MNATGSRLMPAVLMLAAATTPLSGQGIEARASDLTLGGRLQVQYANSSMDGAVDDVFLRRARLELDGALTDRLD